MHQRLIKAKAYSLAVVAVLLFFHHSYEEDNWIDLTCELLASFFLAVSALGRVWASAYISGSKNRQLMTEGPYSITRNPLYFFSFLGFLGAGLAMESLVLTGCMLLVFWATHARKILKEEAKMRASFPDDYEAYATRTPRFWPRPSKFLSQEVLRFRPLLLLRTLSESFMILMVFPTVHLLEWAHLHGWVPVLFRLP